MKFKKNKLERNARVIHNYVEHLKGCRGLSERSIDSKLKSIARFEEFFQYRDFALFKAKHAKAFREHLVTVKGIRSKKLLSKSTVKNTMVHVNDFFSFICKLKEYKKINPLDVDHLNVSLKDSRAARAYRPKEIATIEQVKKVIFLMPDRTLIERRNRAIVAFILLIGARVAAVVSIKIKHISIERRCVFQDGSEVDTKFSKTINSYFFPVGEDIVEVVENWFFELKELGFSDSDPLFPATKVAQGRNNTFESLGLSKAHWKTTQSIRKIFREAFDLANLPNSNPHSIRDTLVHFAMKSCNPFEFKAWSQNLGHSKVGTTYYSYGMIDDNEQRQVMLDLSKPKLKLTKEQEDLILQLLPHLKSN